MLFLNYVIRTGHRRYFLPTVEINDYNVTIDRKNFFDEPIVATLGTKPELKAEQDDIIKLQAFDSSHFCRKSHFEDNSIQNYLVFRQLIYILKRLLKRIIFQHGNLKICLMKVLSFVVRLIIVLLQN